MSAAGARRSTPQVWSIRQRARPAPRGSRRHGARLSGRREKRSGRQAMDRQHARKSLTSQGAGGHALERRSMSRHRVWALVLLVCAVACASPATTARDTPVAAEEPPPRFAPGGPDAEELGASMGYPKGNRATFWRTRSQVGSFSHLDEIFQGRLIHKASIPSRLVRVVEPRITWMLRG